MFYFVCSISAWDFSPFLFKKKKKKQEEEGEEEEGEEGREVKERGEEGGKLLNFMLVPFVCLFLFKQM